MSNTRTVAVTGAGATNVKATVAVNLAVAFASLGVTVRLRDADPERHSARALTGREVERVVVRRGTPMEILAVPLEDEPSREHAAPAIEVVDCAPRMDVETVSAIGSADGVIVAIDGSALSLRALAEVAAVRGSGGGGVHALLTRALPRTVDRWALVERLTERDDVHLSTSTVPMGRTGRRVAAASDEVAAPRLRRAVLYAPGTRAARAYAAVAREIAATLGVVPTGPAPG